MLVNLGINVFFYYICFCFIQIMKHFSNTKKIFSYSKVMLSCLIYYGTNIKRNSFVGNWNRKSSFVDFNFEIILIYVFCSINLYLMRNEDFLKRFHNVRNRNKILQKYKNVLRDFRMKFLPIAMSNLVSLLLLIFFNYVCVLFQVHLTDIFLPFIIL